MKKKRRVILFILIFIIVIPVWLYWGNTSIQTTNISISSEKIPVEFKGFTIFLVSDLHNAEFGSHQINLFDAIKNASPDIIAITGDLIDAHHTNIEITMEFINGAVKIAPVYYVTGNHESEANQYEELKNKIRMTGVVILDDENTIIKHSGESIQLLGLNDPSFIAKIASENSAVIDIKLKNIFEKGSKYTVLLAHRPELFDVYVDNNIDLVLSGHAHGGQFRLPFIGGLNSPNQGFFPKYFEGVYEKNQTKMVVSRGLGNSFFPLRVNNRPELVVVTLK